MTTSESRVRVSPAAARAKIWEKRQCTQTEMLIDLGNERSGIFFVQISMGSETIVQKINIVR